MGKVENLKRRRDECHENLGDVKFRVAFIMQAETFWNEVDALTKAATVKTEQLQRIVALASAKQNTAAILKSKGIQIKTRSFKECWMEVTEMITSEDNNLILYGEVVLSYLLTYLILFVLGAHKAITRELQCCLSVDHF